MFIGFECEMFPHRLSLQLVGLSKEAVESRILVLGLAPLGRALEAYPLPRFQSPLGFPMHSVPLLP